MSPTMDESLAELQAEARSGEAVTRSAAELVRELVAKRDAEDADRRRVAIAHLGEQDLGIRKQLNQGFTLDCECSWVGPLYATPEGASNGWACHVIDWVESRAKAALRSYNQKTGG